jgi:hypothetical protein
MWPLMVFALILTAVFGIGHGIVGAVIGFVAGALIFLAIGAIVTTGRNRE